MRYAITAAVLSLSTAGFSPAQPLPEDTNEITTLTVYQTDALAQQKCKDNLFLNGLTTLRPGVASALARHEGDNLFLNGLTALTPESARALATREGSLSVGVNELSNEVAVAISKHSGELYLHNLASISPQAAKRIVLHRGAVKLFGLKRLSPEASQILRGASSVEIPDRFRQ